MHSDKRIMGVGLFSYVSSLFNNSSHRSSFRPSSSSTMSNRRRAFAPSHSPYGREDDTSCDPTRCPHGGCPPGGCPDCVPHGLPPRGQSPYGGPPGDDPLNFNDEPRHPHKSWKRGGKWQFVWPKDKPHMDNWDRLKDCLTDKGPDIFIATRWEQEEPHRPVWSGWKTRGYQDPRDVRIRWDNAGYPFRQDNELRSWSGDARRGERNGRRYDFLTRKYGRPKGGEWSDVIYDRDNPSRPLYTRSASGYKWWDPQYDCGDLDGGCGENPFRAWGPHERRHPRRRYGIG